MNAKKRTYKRDLSFDEKNGHHYRAAKRTQELKQEKRQDKNLVRYVRTKEQQEEYDMLESWD